MSLHTLLVIALAILGLTAAKSFNGLYEDNDLVVSLNSPSGSKIRGIALKSPKQKVYYGYLDVPYGETTAGNNRFQDPKPKKAWQGILNTTVNSKICPQEGAGEVTEDCLVLNVYTTKHPTAISDSDSKLPVLVWIHGGGFLSGAGSIYSPNFFIDEEILVVTLNYRLGVLGFLNTEDDVIPANLGLKDQRLAIEWVSKNIEKFGGDSNNIKISGESAGSAAVGWHLLGNRTVPFHGAILASGSPLCPFAFQVNSKEHALEVAKAIKFGFFSSDSSDVLEVLRSATLEEIINAGDRSFLNVRFAPAPDKEFSVAPTDDLDNGRIVKVPTLFGFNSEEMLIMLNTLAIDVLKPAASLAFGTYLKSNFKMDFGDDIKIAAQEAKGIYTNNMLFSDELFVKMESDIIFNTPIARHVESMSKYIKDSYLYRLSYRYSLSPPNAIADMTGVGHGQDVPLLWGTGQLSELDKVMSEKMVKVWANFIRTNQPYTEDDEYWPPVNQKVVSYMDLGVTTNNLETNPRNYQDLKKILNKYLIKPMTVF